ncbi:MAG: MopE-related protein [Pseudomonadota bacterium]|nr:MopE-related protein [Pseudomonadota bacterium]
MVTPSLRLLLLLSACGPDVSVSKIAVDADNDGYDEQVDCDDARDDVNPTAEERCDGRDNDCDDVVDEDATDAGTWYADADGDGHGDADGPVVACEAPPQTSANATDCDDGDDGVHPEAVETCNGTDDDCDGSTDEDATDATTAYMDADADGYGDADTGRTACEHPADYVGDDRDCDDTDADVHPDAPEPDCADPVDYNCDGSVAWADADADGWAACEDCDDADATRSPGNVEVCDGAVDEDCDALVDDDDPDVSDAATWYRDADGDAWGNLALTTQACAEPTGFVAVSGDCDDADLARSPGLAEVCDAADLDEDCSGAADDADAGTDASTFAAFARDSDGDGFGDGSRTVTQCDAPAGYGLDATDCDDTDADVHPGGVEVCGGGDEDCDGLADDDDSDVHDPGTWYADLDGDTFGDAALGFAACVAPAGTVADDTDCDDADADDFPGAPETCNDDDEDCDGTADDGVTTTFYGDADGDGYGDSTAASAACALPPGHAANGEDCDDADAAVSPAGGEVCDAADVDEDCDGLADDADPSVTGTTTWFADADGDGYGDATSSRATCAAPSGHGTDSNDCDDGDDDAYPGAEETCGDGVDQDCDGVDPSCGLDGAYTIADADVILTGATSNARWGLSLSSDFDFDGDGWEDVLVTGSADLSTYGGSRSVLDVLTEVPAGESVGREVAAFHAYGDATYSQLAYGSWGLNDLDGDGDDEIAVVLDIIGTDTVSLIRGPQTTSNVLFTGVDYATYSCAVVGSAGSSDALTGYQDWLCGNYFNGSSSQGEVTVYSGLGTVVGTIIGEDTYDYAGNALGGGEDIDGDGYDDYLVGAPHDDDNGDSSGALYVVYAPISSSSTFDLSNADAKVVGAATLDYLGYAVARSPGDVDGDGYADVLVGAHGDDGGAVSAGSVMLFHGPFSGEVEMTDAEATVQGTYALLLGGGHACADMGDVDGDGAPDLLVGASLEATAGSYSGMGWLVAGPLAGTYDLGAGDYAASFGSSNTDEYLGYRCAVSDLDHDGIDDVVLAAPYVNVDGNEDVGVVLGFYGG